MPAINDISAFNQGLAEIQQLAKEQREAAKALKQETFNIKESGGLEFSEVQKAVEASPAQVEKPDLMKSLIQVTDSKYKEYEQKTQDVALGRSSDIKAVATAEKEYQLHFQLMTGVVSELRKGFQELYNMTV